MFFQTKMQKLAVKFMGLFITANLYIGILPILLINLTKLYNLYNINYDSLVSHLLIESAY